MFDSNFKKMSNIVNHDGKSYFVDTNNTFDRGLETMVFDSGPQNESDSESKIDFELIDWLGIYCELHDSARIAAAHHEKVVGLIKQHGISFIRKVDADSGE